MKTKRVAVLCLLGAAAGGPIVAAAQSSITQPVPVSAPRAAWPPKKDGVGAQKQVHPPIDAVNDRGIKSSGSTSESSGAGASMPMQASRR